ncbi:MAG: ACP S-malonyltransferase [Pseudomonadota bacterium]
MLMAKTAFLFPGQGSQAVGMGQDFYQAYAWAQEIFDLADEATGKPISKLCFEGPLEELTRTVNLQPAITAVNLVCFRALSEKGLKPYAVAGHSLGEYSALAAAGVLAVEEALKLVNLRGELMQRDAERRPGAMQAVVGLSREEVESIVELARDHGVVVVANHNSPQQLVITGESEAVAAAAKLVKTKRGRAVPLPVSGAWHSPLMEQAAADFASALEKTKFSAPSYPVYLNVTGAAETDPAAIKKAMARQIISPVRWCDIVENMAAAGVNAFVEVGPKNVLAGLVKKTLTAESQAEILNVQDTAGVTQAAENLGS